MKSTFEREASFGKTVLGLMIVCLIFQIQILAQERGFGNVKVRDDNGQEREVKLYDASYALVIGASGYSNGWQKLSGVKEDVTAVKDALVKNDFVVETLIDPTSENLLPTINRFVNKYGLQTGNRLLIYFAGHGYTETDGDGRKFGYIVPTDAPNPSRNLNLFQQQAVTMDEIEVVARKIRSRHALFIFDSCFSGTLLNARRGNIPDFISNKATKPVRQFISSGAADQEVPDISIFRRQFVEALEGEADRNRDGYVTGSELADFLQEKVTNYTRNSQTPQYGKIFDEYLDKGDFIFTIPPRSAKIDTEGSRTKAASLANQALSEMIRGNLKEAEKLANEILQTNKDSALAYGIRGWARNWNSDDYKAARIDLERAVQMDSNNGLFRARLAVIYRNLNEVELAKKTAEEALERLSSPRTAVDYYARALVYDLLAKPSNSISDYTKAIEFDSKFIIAYNNRGLGYNGQQNYDAAIRDYTSAIDLNPKYFLAYNNRGNAYFAKSDYDSAIRNYTKVIELNPKYAPSYRNRGLSYQSKKEFDKAMQDLNKAIELNPRFSDAYSDRGDIYLELKNYDSAIRDFTKASDFDPQNGWNYFKRGYSYGEKGNYDAAIRDYTKAIELNPKDAGSYNNRGRDYENKQEYAQAIRDYTKAIEIDAKHAYAYGNRGRVYKDINKDFDSAIRDFSKAIELNPQNGIAYFSRGYCYGEKKDYDAAMSDYTKAIELNPAANVAYNNRGNIYKHRKNYDAAIRDYTKSIEIDPEYPLPYINRAYVYQDKKEYDAAIRDFTKVIELEPKSAEAYNNRGNAHYEKKDYEQAVRDSSKAIEIDPNYARAYYDRAYAYDGIGETVKAEADRRKYKELGGK